MQSKFFLGGHVITSEEDLDFITKTIAEHKAVAERAASDTVMLAKV